MDEPDQQLLELLIAASFACYENAILAETHEILRRSQEYANELDKDLSIHELCLTYQRGYQHIAFFFEVYTTCTWVYRDLIKEEREVVASALRRVAYALSRLGRIVDAITWSQAAVEYDPGIRSFLNLLHMASLSRNKAKCEEFWGKFEQYALHSLLPEVVCDLQTTISGADVWGIYTNHSTYGGEYTEILEVIANHPEFHFLRKEILATASYQELLARYAI